MPDLAQRLDDWGAVVAGGAALVSVAMYVLAHTLRMLGVATADPLAVVERGAAAGAFVGLIALLARLAGVGP